MLLGIYKESDLILVDFSKEVNGFIPLFIIPVIISPIFETFLAQSLPYKLLKKMKYINERDYLILLISAIFFGLIHFYSLFYIFYAFLLGLVLMYGYMVRIDSDNKDICSYSSFTCIIKSWYFHPKPNYYLIC